MLKKIIIAAVVLVMSFAVSVAAEDKGKATNAKTGKTTKYKTNKRHIEYEFVKGKGVEICKAYYKNLIRFDPRNIACDRKFDDEFKDFKKPEWVEWDLTENKELSVKIKKFLRHGGDQFIELPDLDNEKLLEKNLKNDPYFIGDEMYFSRIDINNDGNLENVILYNEGRCMDMRVFSTVLIALNEEKTLVDVEKTDPLLQNPSYPKTMKARIASHNYNIYDIFSYKNKIYFDRWSGDGTFCNDTLSVYELSHGKTKELCEYKSLYRCK